MKAAGNRTCIITLRSTQLFLSHGHFSAYSFNNMDQPMNTFIDQ